MFNPEAFLNTETSEATSTQYTPIPEGEYNAVIKSVTGRVTDSGKAILDVMWTLDAEGNEEAHGRDVRQSVFLDITEGGALASGKGQNVPLGRLREAVGQNVPGQLWSPNQLPGNVALVSVKNRQYEDQTFSDVKHVAPLS